MKTNSGSKVVAKKKASGGILETVKTIVYAVLIALVVRTVAYEPFNIPSGSMIPTLLVGDYLFVSKFSYGYSRYSLPFGLPLFSESLPRAPGEPPLEHVIIKVGDNGPLDNTPVYDVPPGHFFAMGDNRDNSQDSRVLSAVGYIPAENLVGRAQFIFFSTDGSA